MRNALYSRDLLDLHQMLFFCLSLKISLISVMFSPSLYLVLNRSYHSSIHLMSNKLNLHFKEPFLKRMNFTAFINLCSCPIFTTGCLQLLRIERYICSSSIILGCTIPNSKILIMMGILCIQFGRMIQIKLRPHFNRKMKSPSYFLAIYTIRHLLLLLTSSWCLM